LILCFSCPFSHCCRVHCCHVSIGVLHFNCFCTTAIVFVVLIALNVISVLSILFHCLAALGTCLLPGPA